MSVSAQPGVYYAVAQNVVYPPMNPIPQSQWPALGLMGIGLILGVAGLIVAAAPVTVVTSAIALGIGVLGLAAFVLGLIDFLLINGIAPAGPASPGP